ncbi:flagellar biosynthesis protein FlhB [Saccharibacillus sp. CPCC 101409]|uniref:flagellar biosynthesis protein FlhB n=1 Tax=Saccharibacillus sp. CPCC 101409 TaxID=3058041 RepID=UPI0026716743|nr:flagellar biosynthesis protein FlhB [Saccharibacillus sp. CPCC 101409]MDO3410685.1 flagellar biosynthesis protein FlhB [Saccharibacillus sp. CPCC 101409]
MELRHKLDLQMFAGEKTEKASPKKRQDSRKKGQVAKSQELPGAAVLIVSVAILMAFGSNFLKTIIQLFTDVFINRMNMDITTANVMNMMTQYMAQIMLMLAPVFGAAVLIAVIANFGQFGLMFVSEGLKPKFSKLNPIKGFKNIFSMRSLVEFLKSILKMTVIGFLVYTTLKAQLGEIAKLHSMTAEEIFHFASSVTVSLGIKIGAALLLLGVFDYMYQKYEFEKGIRMSKQDLKDEYKKAEGDPMIKGKIRERQRRMAMQRMMQDVPGADVIITNPTHYAVALKYDGDRMQAPEVVAKGQDFLALRIREIAKNNGVMIMENKPLARALFAQAEIGDTVPGDLFQAVAEVLAYVYKLKGKVK